MICLFPNLTFFALSKYTFRNTRKVGNHPQKLPSMAVTIPNQNPKNNPDKSKTKSYPTIIGKFAIAISTPNTKYAHTPISSTQLYQVMILPENINHASNDKRPKIAITKAEMHNTVNKRALPFCLRPQLGNILTHKKYKRNR